MLPINIEFAPMEALLVSEIPSSGHWQYEPKWDGFRCLVFRDGDAIAMRSKSGQPLDRYFPEVVAELRKLKAHQFVLDGELVISGEAGFSFDDLLERIHPAASRINKLSVERPATLILFDLLVDTNGSNLTERPIEQRRERLESFAEKCLNSTQKILLSPTTTNFDQASKWWQLVGDGLDGIVAKQMGIPYQSGNRKGMLKAKKLRSADCVIGGFRYAEKSPVVGSILLGLYDKEGLLHHVGYSSAFKADERKKLTEKLEPLIEAPGFTGNAPGGPSRWSTKRSTEWQPLRPELVVEIQYDHFTGGRFRHGTSILRWRPDKAPSQCTLDQIKAPVSPSDDLLDLS